MVESHRIANKDWIIRDNYLDIAGNAITGGNTALRDCTAKATSTGANAVGACLAERGVMNSVVYQPASRFLLFQGIETALFLCLAAIFLGITYWWVTRRIV